jgi:hypothetical protein
MKKVYISIGLMLSVLCLVAQPGNFMRSDLQAVHGNSGTFTSREVNIYPNPVVNKRFTIELDAGYLREIRILNVAGIEVYHKKPDSAITKYQVYTDKLPNGIYLLKVTSGDQISRTYKLLISNNL